MQKRIIIYVFLILGLVIIPGNFAFGETDTQTSAEIEVLNQRIADKKAKIEQLEQSIEEYKKKISQKQLEAVSLSNQIAILDNRLTQVEIDIEITQNKLDSINLEIESLTLNIEKKEKDMERQKDIIAELVREVHQNEGKSYLEILATYDSFSQFYNKIQYLQTIQADLGNSARTLRQLKEELEEKREQKEEMKLSFQKLKSELDNQKQDLNEQTDYKGKLLAATHSSERQYQTMVGNLKSQYQQIEGEIISIEREVRKKLEAQQKINGDLDDSSSLSWPTPNHYITCNFHDPGYPFRHIFEHNGIDIRAGQGTPLRAAASGYVARTKHCSRASCYSFVMLVHSGGLSTVYGHMSQITVSEDEYVARGDVIGFSGGTPGTSGAGPFVTGAHLHFEVRRNGIPVNPLIYLQ